MVQWRAVLFSYLLPCTAESNLYTAQNYGAEASSNTQEKSKIFESIRSVQKKIMRKMGCTKKKNKEIINLMFAKHLHALKKRRNRIHQFTERDAAFSLLKLRRTIVV